MNEKKIIVIGPVYPYKGGISHYTGLLYRALSKKYHTEVISYKMQYPKILLKREQKDFSNDTFKVDGARFLINTANPFNILSVAGKIRNEKPDAVIIEWWHPYFAPCYMILMSKLKKIKKIFICHNVFPHERFPMDKKLTKMVLKKGDAFILHSGTEAQDLLSIRPDADYKVQVHPTYSAFNFDNMDKAQAREKLGIPHDEKLMLFFGYVREYKGLKYLIEAMEILKNKNSEVPKLYVVGDFDGNKDTYLEQIEKAGVGDCVTIVDGYVPDREVEKYFAAADMVVLPYVSATQSGIVQIAYGFEKPVIVTRVGGLPEVVDDNKTGLIVESCDPKALSVAIGKFYENDLEKEFIEYIREAAYRFSWDRMQETITELMDN